MRAAGNGVSLGIIEEAFGDHRGKQAVMAGAYMGLGSIATDALGQANPLSNPQWWGPQSRAFSDAVFFALIEAAAEKGERSWRDFLQNFLYGFGSSFIVGTVAAPLAYVAAPVAMAGNAVTGVIASSGSAIIPASAGAPAVAVNQPVSRTIATSSY